MAAVKTDWGNIQHNCHQSDTFTLAMTGRRPVRDKRREQTCYTAGHRSVRRYCMVRAGSILVTLRCFSSIFGISHGRLPESLTQSTAFPRNNNFWEKGKGNELAKLTHGPWHEQRRALEKHKSWSISVFVWVMGWQSHGYLQPCLFAHPAAISMSQESVDSQKNYKNMAWVFFSFLRATCSQSMRSTTLCVENPINKTVKHLSCNWIPAHGKEGIWAMANSWE